jgi:hypothetical protein
VAQPAWIEWPISGDTNTNTGGSSRKTAIKLKPTDGTMKGTHSIIVTWTDLLTPAHTHTYTALTFTVGCEVTSFTAAPSPSTFTYNVFTSRTIIPLTSVVYTQVPACGYTFTNTFGHTISAGTDASIIFAGTTVTPSFEVYSTTPAHEASYTVTLTNAITIDANQGQTTVAVSAPSVTQTISVVNPCKDTTIN